MRPEQVAVRIDEVPLAIDFLRPEGAGGFELRAVDPTAVLVPLLWTLGLGEFFDLLLMSFFQISWSMNFLWPIFVNVLTIFINERIEVFLGERCCGCDVFLSISTWFP